MSSTKNKPEPLITHAVEAQKKSDLLDSFERIVIRLKQEYPEVQTAALLAKVLVKQMPE